MNYIPQINRRTFIVSTAAVGGGLMLSMDIPLGPHVVRAADGSPEVNAWVVIRPDDTVVIRIARSEMGQGTITGLAQLVAEELECDWSKVTTEYPTPGQSVARKRVWGDMSTGGSRGIRTSHEYVRKGGAAARIMLVQAAANEWKVPASECTASNSVITHSPSGRKTTFGKVAEAAAKLEAPTEITLKDPKDWKIAGKPVKRLDTADKINGKMMYGIDVKLPGMLNAAIKDCPVFGGKVKSFDAAKVAGMEGVKKVVQVGDTAVAVVADTWWRAKTALDALPIVWDEGPNAKVSSATIAEALKTGSTPNKPSSAIKMATRRPPSPVRPRRSRRSTAIHTRTTRPWSHSTLPRSTPPTSVKSGAGRRMEKRPSPRFWRRPDCRLTNATCTSRYSAAVSAGAARSTTT
jgi:isoquinoline 1-oxidoreductase subunit beta